MQEVLFRCSACEAVIDGVVEHAREMRTYDVSLMDVSDELEWHDTGAYETEVQHYECKECGEPQRNQAGQIITQSEQLKRMIQQRKVNDE